MIDVNLVYTVDVRGHPLNVKVNDYSPYTPANQSGSPDNWYPGEGESFDWFSFSGNKLLDDFIMENKVDMEDIERQLKVLIHAVQEQAKLDKILANQDFNNG